MWMARRSEVFALQPLAVRLDSAQTPLKYVYASAPGFNFEIQPEFLGAIGALIAAVREVIAVAKAHNRLVGYLSVPVSAAGGGYRPTNVELAKYTATSVERRFGQRLMTLNPGAFALPDVGANQPGAVSTWRSGQTY